MKGITQHTAIFVRGRARFLAVALMLGSMASAASAAGPGAVNLGTAADFAILAKTGISTTGVTAITGDIGLSPSAATFITGFGLIMDATGTFTTSSLITGKAYASNYTSPTPTKMTTAIGDMQTAYTDAAGRTSPDHTELGAGDITTLTLTPGLYKWGTGVGISAAGVTISGSATDVWIFQVAGDLVVANGAIVTLSGGALASNIFWQVAGQVTIGTTAQMKGNLLCQTQIAMSTGATLNGRALAQSAVTLDANAVTKPATTTGVRNESTVPQAFALLQNYPNPFNPSTVISYQLPVNSQVDLKIYNLIGQEVATLVNERQEAGTYSVSFNTSNGTPPLASGVYFYRLAAGSFLSIKKLVVLK